MPNGGDLSLTCDVVYNQRSDSYSVTLGLELNSMFTPAVIEAIRNLQIDRVETDSDGEIVPNSRMILGRTLDINATVLNYEYPDTILPLAEPVEFHKYTVGQTLLSLSKHMHSDPHSRLENYCSEQSSDCQQLYNFLCTWLKLLPRAYRPAKRGEGMQLRKCL